MSLPSQIGYAASIIADANLRHGFSADTPWKPSQLRSEAERIESETREAVEEMHRTLVIGDAIATALADALPQIYWHRMLPLAQAISENLVAHGYRKAARR